MVPLVLTHSQIDNLVTPAHLLPNQAGNLVAQMQIPFWKLVHFQQLSQLDIHCVLFGMLLGWWPSFSEVGFEGDSKGTPKTSWLLVWTRSIGPFHLQVAPKVQMRTNENVVAASLRKRERKIGQWLRLF